MKKLIIFNFIISIFFSTLKAQEDPYLWLEEVDSQKSLDYINKLSKSTVDKFKQSEYYKDIQDNSLKIYNSTDRIVYPSILGEYVYNFWQDKEHIRGIWRRTPKSKYLTGKPEWEILLDFDKMSKEDNEKWVYKGSSGIYPNYNRFLVSLSRGGGDATIIREYDIEKKTFIDDGFYMEESKGGASYIDKNILLLSSDFGENTMTNSGYPRQTKIWKRGQDLKDAQLIYEGKPEDVGIWGYVMRDRDIKYVMVTRAKTFYTQDLFVWHNERLIKLDIPEDSETSALLNNQLILNLKSDWTIDGKTYKQGSLISLDFKELLKGNKKIQLIIKPAKSSSISGISNTKNKLLVNLLNNVKNELYIYIFQNNTWNKQKVEAPDFGTISLVATDQTSEQYFFNFSNFLTPPTLYMADAEKNTFKAYKSLPAYFDGDKFDVKQYKVKSKDGTMIPYFVVASKNLKNNSRNPTLLYAYGGFEVSMLPRYSGLIGKHWLENGGVYVLANIRGGGEFGPEWHQAGLKEKRQNVYDDFHAVAEDLIQRKITSSKNLGIMGGSNGGLLVGVAFTQRPDLYNAVVCAVPLLDMKRFNKLLAGASWMGEYGNPDKPEEWEYIKKYSPYHNLKKDVKYPEVLFTTSTRDDRVHPAHARKMVAKMKDMGYNVFYYENTEGGHAGSSTNEQRAKSNALTYSYLLEMLKD